VCLWDSWGDDAGKIHAASSLREVLDSLMGVTSWVSWLIPGLLLSNRAAGKYWKLLEMARIDDALLDGVDCYRVRGRFPTTPGHDETCSQIVQADLGETWTAPHTTPVVFWIDKKSCLLRRFEDTMQFPQFRAERVVTYEPEVNVVIPGEQLELGAESL
jgi:hypothetical protein